MKPIPRAVRDYIKRAPVSRVASVQPNNVPHVSPVCHVYDGEFVYLDVAKNGKTAAAMKANPRITVCIDEYYANWRRLRGVILYTRAKEARGEGQTESLALDPPQVPAICEDRVEPAPDACPAHRRLDAVGCDRLIRPAGRLNQARRTRHSDVG